MRLWAVVLSLAVAAGCGEGAEPTPGEAGVPLTGTDDGTEEVVDLPVARPWDGDPDGALCDGGTSPTLVGLDPSTGSPRWVHCPVEPSIYTVIGLSAGVVVALVPLTSGPEGPTFELLAVDAGDGSVRWREEVTHRFSGEPGGLPTGAPGSVGAGGVIVLLIGDPESGTIVARDAVSGDERWSTPGDGALTLAHADDVVVLADQGGPSPSGAPMPQRIRTLDRRTGDERWSIEVVGSNLAHALAGGVLLVDIVGETVGIDLDDGQERWRMRDASSASSRSIGVGSTVVVEPSGPGPRGVVGVDPQTGEERWTVSGIPFNSMWAHDGERVYLHDLESGDILAVSVDDGTERWRSATSGQAYAAGGDRVLVADGDVPGRGDLHGLETDDGTVAWTTPLPLVGDAFATSAAVDDDVAVVAISNHAPRD